MNAVVHAMTRAPTSSTAVHPPRKTEAETIQSALRADRQARNERTARLRAMLLAVGEEVGS